MGKVKEMHQWMEEMGCLTLPYLEQRTEYVWIMVFRDPKTNKLRTDSFIAKNEDDAKYQMNQRLTEVFIKGEKRCG